MKFRTGVALGVLAGMAVGAIAVKGIHAQGTPPIYYVGEIDVTDPEGYTSEYLPKARAIIEASGGRYLATGGPGSDAEVTGFDGDAPKARVVILMWESLDQIKAWRSSPDFQANRKIGEKYAKFRSYAVEGLDQ
jgi:uncharacterized protein (DUF1330 family)